MLLWVGCALAAEAFVLSGGVLNDVKTDIEIQDGRITALGRVDPTLRTVDIEGKTVIPGFIDSHVHLNLWPVHDQLAAGGVVAAIDLAAPIGSLATPSKVLHIVPSGPMITAVGGYPTRSWGSDGYGIECADTEAAVAVVDTLVAAGAQVIKVPLNGPPELPEPTLRAVVARAHHHGLKVLAHAMDDRAVRLASAVGMDALAHTPTAPLSDEAVASWSGKAVISTLSAFGGSKTAVENLRKLHEADAIVLYGTDLGNSRSPRIDSNELRLLASASLSNDEIISAGTTAPAAWWGLELGHLTVGAPASLLVLDANPATDPSTISEPHKVYIGGVLRR